MILLLGCACPRGASGQAWTQGKGAAYLKASFGLVTASEQYTFDGRQADYIDGVERNAFRDRSLYLYGEFGLAEHVTLVLNVPYKRTFIRDQAFRFRTSAWGTATVGARVSLKPLLRWQESPNALAANVVLYVPTGYTRNLNPSAGGGQVNAEVSFGYGRSLFPLPLYAQAQAGYRLRTAWYDFTEAVPCQEGQDINCMADRTPDLGDEWTYSVEVGWTPFEGGILVQALVQGVSSVREPEVGFTATNPVPLRQRYIKTGGGLVVYPFALVRGLRSASVLAPIGLGAQFFHTPDGRNAIRSHDLFLGIEYRLTVF